MAGGITALSLYLARRGAGVQRLMGALTDPTPKGQPPYHLRDFDPREAEAHMRMLAQMEAAHREFQKREELAKLTVKSP